jgi:flagellin
MRINTNVSLYTSQAKADEVNKELVSSLEKLSTGRRINSSVDDRSGVAIANTLRSQATSLTQGIKNANFGNALIEFTDSAMSEQSNILDMVKTKLIQASTDTTSDNGREAIRKDITKLLEQFDNIAAQTNYNGKTLLQKSAIDTSKADDLSMQLGQDSSFNVVISSTTALNTTGLGGGSDKVLSGAVGASVTNADGESNTTNNNIKVGESQQINTSHRVMLSDVEIDASGVETDNTNSDAKLNLNISGKIGTVMDDNNDITFHISNQNDEIKDSLKNIASANSDFTDNGDDTFLLNSGKSVAFGDLNFSAMNITTSDVGSDLHLNMNETETTINIHDKNDGTDKPLLGQINILGDDDMIGGHLLLDIKALNKDELTLEKANSFLNTVDEALATLSKNRNRFGDVQNRLNQNIGMMDRTILDLKKTESIIVDVDYGAESLNFN